MLNNLIDPLDILQDKSLFKLSQGWLDKLTRKLQESCGGRLNVSNEALKLSISFINRVTSFNYQPCNFMKRKSYSMFIKMQISQSSFHFIHMWNIENSSSKMLSTYFHQIEILQVEKEREEFIYIHTKDVKGKWNHVNEIKNFCSFSRLFFCLQSQKCYWISLLPLCEEWRREIEKCNQPNVISCFSSFVFICLRDFVDIQMLKGWEKLIKFKRTGSKMIIGYLQWLTPIHLITNETLLITP